MACIACISERVADADVDKLEKKVESTFDKVKWATMEGEDYPYRDEMLNDLVYNDTIRSLSKNEILALLGEPSFYREDRNFLHYTITQKRIGSWPLRTKTLVIKCLEDNSIEWIKIHE